LVVSGVGSLLAGGEELGACVGWLVGVVSLVASGGLVTGLVGEFA